MTPDAQLDYEFAFSRQMCANYSCGDLYSPAMECRRLVKHDGEHAAGYGDKRQRWDREVEAA